MGAYHTVSEGESLSSIAEEYGTTVDDIMAVNELCSATVRVGQRIFIPRSEIRSSARGETSGSDNNIIRRSSGGLMWPLSGGEDRIVSGFGRRQDPIGGGNEFHKGIDIDGWKGERVYAAQSGVVVYAGSKGGYGNMVMIDHGSGLVTLYAHLSSIVVRAGQRTEKGSTIGYVGSSGYSTGSHLHFEVRESGAQVDPVNHLPD